jgi:hypothetical protein
LEGQPAAGARPAHKHLRCLLSYPCPVRTAYRLLLDPDLDHAQHVIPRMASLITIGARKIYLKRVSFVRLLRFLLRTSSGKSYTVAVVLMAGLWNGKTPAR